MVNGAFSVELLDGVMDGVFEGVDMGEGSVCETVSRGPAPAAWPDFREDARPALGQDVQLPVQNESRFFPISAHRCLTFAVTVRPRRNVGAAACGGPVLPAGHAILVMKDTFIE